MILLKKLLTYLLHCKEFSPQNWILFNKTSHVHESCSTKIHHRCFEESILGENSDVTKCANQKILEAVLGFIKGTKRLWSPFFSILCHIQHTSMLYCFLYWPSHLNPLRHHLPFKNMLILSYILVWWKIHHVWLWYSSSQVVAVSIHVRYFIGEDPSFLCYISVRWFQCCFSSIAWSPPFLKGGGL